MIACDLMLLCLVVILTKPLHNGYILYNIFYSPRCVWFPLVQRGHRVSGALSFNLEGPASWIAVHAAARVLRSRLVVGRVVVLRVEEMAALMSCVGGRQGWFSRFPPR